MTSSCFFRNQYLFRLKRLRCIYDEKQLIRYYSVPFSLWRTHSRSSAPFVIQYLISYITNGMHVKPFSMLSLNSRSFNETVIQNLPFNRSPWILFPAWQTPAFPFPLSEYRSLWYQAIGWFRGYQRLRLQVHPVPIPAGSSLQEKPCWHLIIGNKNSCRLFLPLLPLMKKRLAIIDCNRFLDHPVFTKCFSDLFQCFFIGLDSEMAVHALFLAKQMAIFVCPLAIK